MFIIAHLLYEVIGCATFRRFNYHFLLLGTNSVYLDKEGIIFQSSYSFFFHHTVISKALKQKKKISLVKAELYQLRLCLASRWEGAETFSRFFRHSRHR